MESDLAPVKATSLRFGGAFGKGPDLGRVIALDGYGRPSWLDLRDRTKAPAPTLDLLEWLGSSSRSLTLSSQVMPMMTINLALTANRKEAYPQNEQHDEHTILNHFALTGAFDQRSFRILHRWDFKRSFGLTAAEPGSIYDLLGAAAFSSPYLALMDVADGIVFTQEVERAVSLRLGFISDQLTQSASGGSAEVWVGEVVGKLTNGSWLGLQLGGTLEGDRLLGSEGGGALDLPPTSTTLFAGLAGTLYLDYGLELFGQASLGLTDPDSAAESLLRNVSALRSSSFGIGFARRELFSPGDRFTVAVSQPLRVDAGTAVFDRPVGWTPDGSVLRRPERISLEPEGREVDIEFDYRLHMGSNASISLNWLTQYEPRHDQDASPTHTLAIKLRREF